ncbi:type II secretion system protein [Bordetella genomosp. 8]|uniref:type II secretion system protein n=1 Tax=Bordetella genomosp. 8 TaxID=1416806 RepID=UPI0022B75F4B|nr:shufflon system plasmid conjugative transfer pilus tip adhesin PilV [Bordetella genomosp. 8]
MHRGGRPRRRAGQRGFALLELTVAVAITCMLAIWAAERLLHQVDSVAEQAAGRWLLEIHGALDGMLVRHGAALAEGDVPVDGQGRALYADPWAPSLAELRGEGHLPASFPDHGPLGMRATVRLWRDGACPGQACRVEALAYARAASGPATGPGVPVAAPGGPARSPDLSRIAGILLATGGLGAGVSELAPHRLRGAGFDLPNPPAPGMARLPIGTVAVRAGREAGDAGRYLRTQDARDPQFRGDVSATGTLSTGGRLVAGEHLKLGAVEVAGTPCPESGLLARDGDGGLLNCAAGTWAVPGGFGGAYATNSGIGCGIVGRSSINPRTGACSCPPGHRAVLVAAGGERDAEVGWTEGYVCLR